MSPASASSRSRSVRMRWASEVADAAGVALAGTVRHGRASVAVASESASPSRRCPKSTPRSRMPQIVKQYTGSVRLRALGALVLLLAVAAACSRTPPESHRPKLVILGFDGLDPDLV